MDAGKVIIIDNSVATLSAGSEFFSRFFIALVRSAAEQRAGRKPADKMPVYFYIDEADTVISRDESVREIIQRCRSQNIAMIFAHQALQQIKSDDVKAALTDCAIRLANSDEEAPSSRRACERTPSSYSASNAASLQPSSAIRRRRLLHSRYRTNPCRNGRRCRWRSSTKSGAR